MNLKAIKYNVNFVLKVIMLTKIKNVLKILVIKVAYILLIIKLLKNLSAPNVKKKVTI